MDNMLQHIHLPTCLPGSPDQQLTSSCDVINLQLVHMAQQERMLFSTVWLVSIIWRFKHVTSPVGGAIRVVDAHHR